MKIKNGYNKASTQAVKNSETSGVSAGKKTESASESQSASTSSAVQVSTGGLADALSSQNASRSEFVAQIKLKVETGAYKSDPERTASKLVDSLTEYSLA